MKQAYLEASHFNEQRHRLISAFLIGLMMAAAGLSISQAGRQISSTWQADYLAVIGFLIAIERFYTLRAIKKMSTLSREWVVALSTQWIINLLVIKLMVLLSAGFEVLVAEIPRWQRAFPQSFFNAEYLAAVIFALIIWFFTGALVELLDAMGLNAALIAREVITAERDATPPRQRLMAIVFGFGAVLMFFTAMARVDLRALFESNLGIVHHNLSPLAAGGAGTLLYFMFALALLSQGNYITLNTRWFLQRVPVSRAMASRWAIYSLAFLLLLILIASILPTSYSLGFLSVMGYLLDLLISFFMLLVGIIMAVLGFIISLPFLLFNRDVPADLPQAPRPTLMAPPPELVTPTAPIPWLELLKSVIFWAIFILVVGYSIVQYLRQHEEVMAALRKFPGWKIISAFWDWISSLFGNLNRGMNRVIAAGKARLRPQVDPTNVSGFSRLLGLRRLSPRQKVYFYYHALLRRGDESGLPRASSQTPQEYAQTLESSLPTIETDIQALTESFNEARYSPHPVDDQKASTVKAYWEHIRQVFRGRRG